MALVDAGMQDAYWDWICLPYQHRAQQEVMEYREYLRLTGQICLSVPVDDSLPSWEAACLCAVDFGHSAGYRYEYLGSHSTVL